MRKIMYIACNIYMFCPPAHLAHANEGVGEGGERAMPQLHVGGDGQVAVIHRDAWENNTNPVVVVVEGWVQCAITDVISNPPPPPPPHSHHHIFPTAPCVCARSQPHDTPPFAPMQAVSQVQLAWVGGCLQFLQ